MKNTQVKFQLDTSSDVGFKNQQTWMKIDRPTLLNTKKLHMDFQETNWN